jgi:DNA-binding NtrC family response regulator
MTARPPVLLIDDEESISDSIATFLKAKGYSITVTNCGTEGLRLAAEARFPLIISDIYIDRVTGIDILKAAKGADPDCAVILMTAKGSVRTTVEAEAEGVFDYLPKPFELSHLLEVMERAARSLKPEIVEEVSDPQPDDEMVGVTPIMIELYKAIARAARTDATVLIRGETGTGKELVARAIHNASLRSHKQFVPVDCAAIPDNLWESELFGSIRGAFTSAERDRAGIVEQAQGGTVFLDEVGEIPLSFQSKLLRFLEAREFRPVGATTPRKADTRVVAATHRPLENMVSAGEFRADLFHRLNVLPIPVPALRERRQDIPRLASRFLAESKRRQDRQISLNKSAMAALEEYDWPGNVRELKHVIERLVTMSPQGPLDQFDIRRALAVGSAESSQTASALTLEDAERDHVLQVLRECGGNRTMAAERLGIQRRTLYKKLERWQQVREGHSAVPETQKIDPEEKF